MGEKRAERFVQAFGSPNCFGASAFDEPYYQLQVGPNPSEEVANQVCHMYSTDSCPIYRLCEHVLNRLGVSISYITSRLQTAGCSAGLSHPVGFGGCSRLQLHMAPLPQLHSDEHVTWKWKMENGLLEDYFPLRTGGFPLP